MKQKYINSISLLAVCAVLSGCGNNSDKQKSVSELVTGVGRESQKLSALSQEALDQAKLKGVPLSSEVERIFKNDMVQLLHQLL